MIRYILLALFASLAFALDAEDPGLSEFDHEYFENLEKANKTVFETDILTSGQVPDGGKHSALGDPNSKWPGAQIPVVFSPTLSKREKNAIVGAIHEIEEKTCVKFHHKTDDDSDFVTFLKPWEGGCSSYVGRIGGGQPLNLGNGCYERNTILHEIMHALGFIHEHNRSDRDDYVTIEWGNIQGGMEHNFNKRRYEDLELMDTPYSFESIMHYSEYAFTKYRGHRTIVPKQSVGNIGGEQRLSDIDTLRINRRFSCSGRGGGTGGARPNPPTAPPQPTWTPTVPWFTGLAGLQNGFRCIPLPNGFTWCIRSIHWT